jgi:hypothetical protein
MARSRRHLMMSLLGVRVALREELVVVRDLGLVVLVVVLGLVLVQWQIWV